MLVQTNHLHKMDWNGIMVLSNVQRQMEPRKLYSWLAKSGDDYLLAIWPFRKVKISYNNKKKSKFI